MRAEAQVSSGGGGGADDTDGVAEEKTAQTTQTAIERTGQAVAEKTHPPHARAHAHTTRRDRPHKP